MAVHDRSYRPYKGPLTSTRWRFLVFPRYAYRDVFKSRLFTGFFTLCFVFPLLSIATVYLRHNITLMGEVGSQLAQAIPIDQPIFYNLFLVIQSCFSFLLAMVIGPALVAPELVNGALPLILSRPIRTTDYVIGKLSVLLFLMSAITWVPGILVFSLHGIFNPGWVRENLHLGVGVVVGSMVIIFTLGVMALALSSLLKSKAVARAVMILLMIIPFGLGAAGSALFKSQMPLLLSPQVVAQTIWGGFFGVMQIQGIPVWGAWLVLAAVVSGCALIIRSRLIPCEEIR